MDETRLPLRTVVEAVAIVLARDEHGYWTMRVSARRNATHEWVVDSYEWLTRDELEDVLAAASFLD